MRKDKNEESARGKETKATRSRKPYRKPACVSEQIFETTALACGKRPGQGGACVAVPRLS